ncbi:MAG: anion permease, partial [Polyangiaceae bacterium]|nr:anion permease [Polyangiaceae bacterium]
QTIGSQLSVLLILPPYVLLLLLCLGVSLLTEVTSNTATTALLMPILGALEEQNGFSASTFMFPAALSASCAFMLPAATAPNAIIFSTGELTPGWMAKRGIFLNLIASFLIATGWYLMKNDL